MPELVEVTKTYEIYSLDEMLADKELKKNLLKANEPDEWMIGSDLKIEVEEIYSKLESMGFIDPSINYDLSYCQGSGACFDCRVIKLSIVLKDIYKDLGLTEEDYNIIVKLDEDDWIYYHTRRNGYANHYSHSRTRYISEEHQYSYEDYPEYARDHWGNDYDKMDEIFGDSGTIIRYLSDKYQEICYDIIYRPLQKRYEYLTSEDGILEDIKNQGWNKFLKNGIVFNN